MKAENDMTEIEAADYIAAVDMDGITLTPSGCGAARLILEQRSGWSPSHALMLERILKGATTLPHKLGRLVSRTRLGMAIELAESLNRNHIRNQKRKARRRAVKARYAACTAPAGTTTAAA